MIVIRAFAVAAVLAAFTCGSIAVAQPAAAPSARTVLTGKAAFGDWQNDKPGVVRHIRPSDMPPPYASRSSSNSVSIVRRPAGTVPKVPSGFVIHLYATLTRPRLIQVAPNSDVFVAESAAGRIAVMRPGKDGKPETIETFASGLDYPFGIAFYPLGNDPQWVYVGNTNSVVRFPYRNGDLKARGRPQVIVPHLPTGGHATRTLAFSKDGAHLFVSVGSASNDAEGMGRLSPGQLRQWERTHALGAARGEETDRADVLEFNPDGGHKRLFATGIRNCVGLTVQPATGELWCSTNERDRLGNNVPPDYITRVRQGAFYGWPWYYIGAHQDPRHKGERLDLKGRITVPDVLIQAHSASLQMTFYEGRQFPASYRGDAFAAEHGSWNRAKPTGYKVIRVLMKNGIPTGAYEDFVTGFVIDSEQAWGRPVGVAVLHDGSLLVSEDGNGTVWRVTYRGSGGH